MKEVTVKDKPLKVLNQLVDASGHQFTIVTAGSETFIHYQTREKFAVFSETDEGTARKINNFLAAHFGRETT